MLFRSIALDPRLDPKPVRYVFTVVPSGPFFGDELQGSLLPLESPVEFESNRQRQSAVW